MTQFWLSFVDHDRPDGQKFLGASIVEADDAIHAVQEAHRLGCNPGGEVLIAQFDQRTFDVSFRNRLLTRDEAEMLARRPS